MNRGDTLLVNVTNHLSNATSMHWHGMFQNGTNWMDGITGVTQCPIPPGKSFLYNFTVQNQFGTYWYHAHYQNQYIDGINGPLIIHAPEEAQTRQLYDFDQVIMLQDWYHDLSGAYLASYLAPDNENAEPVPDNGLVQGTNYFNCSSLDPSDGYQCTQNSTMAVFAFEQGKRYRLRFINTGAFTPFTMSIDNHTLQVIEADGTLTIPVPIHRVEVATAERYSVVLTMNRSASTNYW
jgi:FtsP/CotA-like multicopper oxidase with cupredoxin domain